MSIKRGTFARPMCLALPALAFALSVLAEIARAQSVVASGLPDAGHSFGAAERSVVLDSGTYFVFFDDGTEIVVVTTIDGVNFSPPTLVAQTTGLDANLGFSVARSGSRIALFWGNVTGATYSTRYLEGTIGAGAITWPNPAVLVASSTDERGFLPAVTFSTGGYAALTAMEFNNFYNGSNTGCNTAKLFRPGPYYCAAPSAPCSSFQFLGYCNNYTKNPSPLSTAIVPIGNGNVVHSATIAQSTTDLSTGIFDPTQPPVNSDNAKNDPDAGVGEPWEITKDPTNTVGDDAQMSAAQGRTRPTDVHYVYLNNLGQIEYARQDGTNNLFNASALDGAILTSSSTSHTPTISRPGAATGCYLVAWIDGNSILGGNFRGDTAAGGAFVAASTGFYPSRPAVPTWLGAEYESVFAPALTWQEGGTLYFGSAPGGSQPQLTPSPGQLPADGLSTTTVSSSAFLDACGSPIPSGTLVTVTASAGTITDPDQSASLPGAQVAAATGGTVSFTVLAPTTPVQAALAAMTASGAPFASCTVLFYSADGGPPLDAGADSGTGGSSDAGTVRDSGIGADAGSSLDAAATADAGGTDSGAMDSGGRADAGSPSFSVSCGCASGVAPSLFVPSLLPPLRRRRYWRQSTPPERTNATGR